MARRRSLTKPTRAVPKGAPSDAPLPEDAQDRQSSQSTAKRAGEILAAKGIGFMIPSASQRRNLLVAFAKRGKVVYGRAFDVVRLAQALDLSDLAAVEAHLDAITVYEVKSSRKKLPSDFGGYFFALTAAEVLVAQSLRDQFKFAFVNTVTKEHLELTLSELWGRARAVYPTWSILF